LKTQGEQVCMARSGLYHSRPASITSYTNDWNELNRPKQTDKTQIKTLKTHTTQTNIYQAEHN